MFSARLIPLLTLALASLVVVRGDVFPNFPAADIQKTGSTCHIAWGKDTASTTAWKDMTIQLMTGDNFNMVHITTVATGQDGTKDGTFDWKCPDVTPHSAIYFYQFRSPHTPNYAWTTRFTIASSTGATTPPTNATQPNGDPIPWGTGRLVNPSEAKPPPQFPTTTTTTGPPGPTGTPTNAAPGIPAGCTGWFTEPSPALLCWEIVNQFSITLEQFQEWNGGANVCNVLQVGLAYCVAHPTSTNPPPPVNTPSNAQPNIVAGCTSFFTETNLLCFEIAERFGITVDQFTSWNGGEGVCGILQTGLAYCVMARPPNAAPGAISTCTKFFEETNLLCWEIASQFGISVAQFESWNGGAGVCNVLQSGLSYCVSAPA